MSENSLKKRKTCRQKQGIMKSFGLLILLFLFILNACSSNEIRVVGELKTEVGDTVALYGLSAESGDTLLLVAQGVEGGVFDLRTDKLQLPAKVGLDIGGEKVFFIVESEEAVQVKKEACDSCKIRIEAGELERGYQLVYEILNKKYDIPARKLQERIQVLEQKPEKTESERKEREELYRDLDRCKRYRKEYIKRTIQANPAHELSLFLLWDELGDEVECQDSLLRGMKIINKKSNIYRLLAQKLL